MKEIFREILWWIWPTTQEMQRRSGIPKAANPPPPPPEVTQKKVVGVFVNGHLIGYASACDFDLDNGKPLTHKQTLENQLHQAVDSENYEEAARLRDEILKQKQV